MKARIKITSEVLKDTFEVLYTLKIYQIIYEDLENPIAPWMAFKLCREKKHNIPNWVLSYFDECSVEIGSMKKLADKDLFNALKFSKNDGERSFATQYKEVAKYFDAVRDCYILSERGDRSKPELKRMDDIFSLVGEKTGLGEEVINKRYYRHKQIISDMTNSLIKGDIEIEDKVIEVESNVYESIIIDAVKSRYPSMVRS